PDGQWIAFVAYIERENSMAENFTGVFLMRAGGEGEVRLYERTGDSVSFTDDSRRMASYNHVWDLTTGNHKEVKPAKFDYETKFLPGRVRAIVFVRNEQTAKESVVPELRDIETGKVLHRFPPIDTSIGAAVSGGGNAPVYCTRASCPCIRSRHLNASPILPTWVERRCFICRMMAGVR
ncbi:MAG TPA: hypothetical protein PKA58_34580, partial [Polyangium sp.]|nr:hypothetical protein [Polyangium sp.]